MTIYTQLHKDQGVHSPVLIKFPDFPGISHRGINIY